MSDLEHERQSAKAARAYSAALAERVVELTAAKAQTEATLRQQSAQNAEVVAQLHEQARLDGLALREAHARIDGNVRSLAALAIELEAAQKGCQLKDLELQLQADAWSQERAQLAAELDHAGQQATEAQARQAAELDALQTALRERASRVADLERQLEASAVAYRELEQMLERTRLDLAWVSEELRRRRADEQTSLALTGLRSLRTAKDRVLPHDSLQRRGYDWLLGRLKKQ